MKRFGLPLIWITIGVTSISTCFATLSGSLDEKQIILRLKPDGEVNIDKTDAPIMEMAKPTSAQSIGEQRYNEVCHVCHGTGLGGAPKFGDKAEWAPRIAEGMDVLMKHAIEGYKAMPPKGTCMNCTNDEIKAAIEYMISHSK